MKQKIISIDAGLHPLIEALNRIKGVRTLGSRDRHPIKGAYTNVSSDAGVSVKLMKIFIRHRGIEFYTSFNRQGKEILHSISLFPERAGKSLDEMQKEIIKDLDDAGLLTERYPHFLLGLEHRIPALSQLQASLPAKFREIPDWFEWVKRYLAKKYLDEADRVTTEGSPGHRRLFKAPQLNVIEILERRDMQPLIHSAANPSSYLEKADSLYENRKFDEAAELYRKVIDETGERRAREMIIPCYVELGEHEQALAEFTNIIIDPNEPLIYGCDDMRYGWDVSIVPPLFSRTDWLLKVYDVSWNSSKGELLKVLEHDANSLDDVTRYQMLLHISPHGERCWKAYNKLLELAPSMPTFYLDAVYWRITEDFPAVVEAMLKNVPINADTVWYFGKVAEELQKMTLSDVAIGLAIEIYERILRPGFEEILFYYRNLAKCYERQNKLDAAMEAYKEANLAPRGWPQETAERIIENEMQELRAKQHVIISM